MFQRYRTELQNLAQKIGELESELEEHSSVPFPVHRNSTPPVYELVILDMNADGSLVLSTLQPLVKTAPNRTCYRLIGGVLVERTVVDVVPTLETNYGGIKEVLESLMKTYKNKEEEFGGFQKEYGIQVSFFTPGGVLEWCAE